MSELRYFSDGGRHLVCLPYSVENLHAMAEQLGIKRCWFHSGPRAHYDIPLRRISEIASKTEVVDGRRIVEIIRGARCRCQFISGKPRCTCGGRLAAP